jgi:hypothetical protein
MKLTVAILILMAAVSSFAPPARAASSQMAHPKSYAVFIATYDPATGSTIGGVAGSAFFISETEAITAFHVLQPSSFTNPHTQAWLVHENEPAIELTRSDLQADPSLDRTSIRLTRTRAPIRYIYERGTAAPGARVETDGFIANSAGPILELALTTPTSDSPTTENRNGNGNGLGNGNRKPTTDPRLRITSVPHLSRLHAEGNLLRHVRVELSSNDVNLKNAPCVQVSYKPVVGLSGGPVVSGDRVVGMNSFAEPESRASTFAVGVSQN